MLAGVVGIAASKQLLPRFGRAKRNLSPAQKIAARDKWREAFERYFLEMARDDYQGDAIIHDVDRLDEYPESREGKVLSSWFRVGLAGTYHRGVLLLLNAGLRLATPATADDPAQPRRMLALLVDGLRHHPGGPGVR